MNPVHQALSQDCTPQIPYSVEYLEIKSQESKSFICLVTITKSSDVHCAAAGTAYVGHHAASSEIQGQQIVDLSLSKGAQTYENQELGDYYLEEAVEEQELKDFLSSVSPAMMPRDFLRRERLTTAKPKELKSQLLCCMQTIH